MSASTPAPLAADLEGGLRRLKLASMRAVAPQLLITAKTQRWTPEELLRALVETEINARDASNTRLRSKQACFPMVKTLEEFDLTASSIPAPTWAYLTSLEWIAAKENLTLVGPAGTGKSHTLIALGHAAVAAGHRVRYFTAAELIETLYRGLADNSVGRIIETVLRNDVVMIDEVGFAPLDDTGTQMLFGVRRRSLRTPKPGHRLTLALPTMGPLPARTHHRRQPPGPAAAPQQHRRHRRRVLPDAPSPRPQTRPPCVTLPPQTPRPKAEKGSPAPAADGYTSPPSKDCSTTPRSDLPADSAHPPTAPPPGDDDEQEHQKTSHANTKEAATAASNPTPRRQKRRPTKTRASPRGGDFQWPPAGTATWPLTLALGRAVGTLAKRSQKGHRRSLPGRSWRTSPLNIEKAPSGC